VVILPHILRLDSGWTVNVKALIGDGITKVIYPLHTFKISNIIGYDTMNITGKKIVKLIVAVSVGVWIFSYFVYYDFETSCFIKLKPGLMSFVEFNHSNIKEGLQALKYGTPDVYAGVCSNIDTIESDYGCGGWQGGCHYGEEGRITLSTTHSEFVGWTAAIIGHEYCHDLQLREGRSFSEEECYSFDSQILQTIVGVYPN